MPVSSTFSVPSSAIHRKLHFCYSFLTSYSLCVLVIVLCHFLPKTMSLFWVTPVSISASLLLASQSVASSSISFIPIPSQPLTPDNSEMLHLLVNQFKYAVDIMPIFINYLFPLYIFSRFLRYPIVTSPRFPYSKSIGSATKPYLDFLQYSSFLPIVHVTIISLLDYYIYSLTDLFLFISPPIIQYIPHPAARIIFNINFNLNILI